MSTDFRVRDLEQRHGKFIYHRRLQIAFFICRNVLLGVQDSIILPSLWQYVKRFHVEKWTYGAIIAAYPISALLFAPFFGVLYDKTLRTREILDVTNVFLVLGSLLYSLPFSSWLLFLGRFLSGIGFATEAVISAEVSLLTHSNDRISSLSLVHLGFVLGLMLGPPLTFAFAYVEINLGRWHIDYTNLPGLFTGLIWLLLFMPQCFIVRSLVRRYNLRDTEENEDIALVAVADRTGSKGQLCAVSEDQDRIGVFGFWLSAVRTAKQVCRELFCLEMFGVLLSAFWAVALVNATSTLLPLVLQEDFGWGILYTNLVLLSGGLLAAASSVIFGTCGHHFSDVYSILVINGIGSIAPIFLVGYDVTTGAVIRKLLFFSFLFVVGVFSLLTYPCTSSLVANTAPPKLQGGMQSVANIVFMAGNGFGCVWGSGLYQYMLSFNLTTTGFFIICTGLVAVSLPRLREKKLRYLRMDL